MAVLNHLKQGVEFRIVTKEEKAVVDRESQEPGRGCERLG